jgi:hypothetical protein
MRLLHYAGAVARLSDRLFMTKSGHYAGSPLRTKLHRDGHLLFGREKISCRLT